MATADNKDIAAMRAWAAEQAEKHGAPTMPTRPDCWARGMDFLGDPEAPQIEDYVERLEAYARYLETRITKSV